MQITQDNTETILLKTLKELKIKAPTFRCLFFRASKMDDAIEGRLERLSQAFAQNIDDTNAHMFVCEDGDVFILSRHTTQKTFHSLLSHPHLKQWLALSDREEPAILFEVGYDSIRVQDLLKEKIKIQQQKQQAIEIAFEERKKEQALNTPICEDMIASLPDRREGRETPHILIVEDDPFTQKLIHKAIGKDYELTFAGSATKALLQYVRHAPDILFLDIGLPDVDGHQVLNRVLEIDHDAFIVMLSGNGNKENIVKAIGNGAKGFVGKPFTTGKLEDYIQKSPHIKRKYQQQEAS